MNARALFFLATPGRRAVGSGFVSQDNPDDTALNMRKALAEAGFRRPDVVLWNVVPHCVSTRYQDRKVSDSQVRKAVPDSQAFVDELLKSRRLVSQNVRKSFRAGKSETYRSPAKRMFVATSDDLDVYRLFSAVVSP